jgi:antirestriction protein ArdC
MVKKTDSDRIDIYTRITDRIVEDLEQGVRPWIKPWSVTNTSGRIIRPMRHNGIPYCGINVLLLWSEQMSRGFSSSMWMTFKQALGLGGAVRKGETGSTVVFASRFTTSAADENGHDVEREIPFLKAYSVFNIEQIDGLPDTYHAPPEKVRDPVERIESADRFFRNTGAVIRHGGNQAYYSPVMDHIQMPPFEAFRDAAGYAAVLSHEATHNAAIRIMPHGLRWRSVSLVSAMRLFGIIRALPGRQAGYRRAGTAPKAWPEPRRGQAPFPSFACRHGCRSGWSRRSRDQARAR